MGQNIAVVVQVPHFGPSTLKNLQKGVPKRVEIQVPPNLVFSMSNDSWS